MATATALMTMEEYLHTAYSPDCDFVDGELLDRQMGEKDHGRLQVSIALWFAAHEETLGAEPITEPRIRVTQSRVRICDVAIIRTNIPDEQVAITPPLVCIEILSPEDRLSRAIQVLEDYRSMGVENIWLIDPQERLVYTFTATGLQQQEGRVLCVTGTQVAMDVNVLFAALDRKKARSNRD